MYYRLEETRGDYMKDRNKDYDRDNTPGISCGQAEKV